MKIFIGGDLVPTYITEKDFVEKNGKKLFGKLLPMMQNADRTIINLECALTTTDKKIRKCGPNLKADPLCADALKDFGVTDVMLSNNHVYDFGEEGLFDTMKNLDRVGLPFAGVGKNNVDSRKPYYIKQDGKTIGIINVCEHEYSYALENDWGANPYDPYLTMHDIREIKKHSDFVFVIYHGGKEHCRYPSPRLRLLCHEMAECGADMVICQHSHCIGCYEKYEGTHILYGQGNLNFVNGNSNREGWYTAFALMVTVENDIKIDFYPVVSGDYGVDVASEDEANKIMSEFEKRNEQLIDGSWINGWKEFCNCKEESYYRTCLTKMFNPDSTEHQNETFAHYLDCEAHTDVWRELYPTWHKTERGKN